MPEHSEKAPRPAKNVVEPYLSNDDIYLFRQGSHYKLYYKLGCHLTTAFGIEGAQFAVWAPNARRVTVIGDFNGWNHDSHPLDLRPDGSGIWEKFIPGIRKGTHYKYFICSQYNNYQVRKADPFAFHAETPPQTASIVWDLDYEWNDKRWMAKRRKHNSLQSPVSVYEVHLGSWRRSVEGNNRFLSYRELAPLLAEYVKKMGFTHVEFMPVMEHPFAGSWGYQLTGYFAPTARYGTPQDFMYLVDHLHQNDIGVILDWVPSHFSQDEHGPVYFDGTHLYEHADPRRGFHPDWQCYIFNYGRNEVRNFLVSSALFWLEYYHIDGLRTDAVASMLYLDYSRRNGEWIPNKYGGKENLDAIEFLRHANEFVYDEYPDVQTIAEESTAWPMVSKPTSVGGLGFGMKWNMGWMHDTLYYFAREPVHRKFHHNQLTFSMWYAFFENFVLSLSHDEVVHGKRSLLEKMPGDDWQKFANLRLLFGYMYGWPGKKLVFMGGEFGQRHEWNHDASLDWHLLDYAPHQGVQRWVQDISHLYRKETALHQLDCEQTGFEWIDFSDWQSSIISFIRKGTRPHDVILVVCNFTPVVRTNYRIGVPFDGTWQELLNSDRAVYGGSGVGNPEIIEAIPSGMHGRPFSVTLTLPPLGILFLKHRPKKQQRRPPAPKELPAPLPEGADQHGQQIAPPPPTGA